MPADFRLPPHLQAAFAYDDTSQSQMSRLASDLATPITIWGRIVPIVTGVLGVVALVAGGFLINPRVAAAEIPADRSGFR